MSSRVIKSDFSKIILMTLVLVIVFSGMAFAQKDQAAANAIAIDTMWTLIAAFLVFFMQAGFAMVLLQQVQIYLQLLLLSQLTWQQQLEL